MNNKYIDISASLPREGTYLLNINSLVHFQLCNTVLQGSLQEYSIKCFQGTVNKENE